MSTSYEYYLTTGTLDDVRGLLSAVFGLALAGVDWELPNCVVSAYEPDDDDLEAVQMEVAIEPSLIVRFTYPIGCAGIVEVRRVSEALAQRFPGDAVLAFNSERIVWERRGAVSAWRKPDWAQPSIGHTLRLRIGTEGDAVIQLRTDGTRSTRTEGHVHTGELADWTWVALKTARKDLRSLRVYELRPSATENAVRVGDLEVSGRFDVLAVCSTGKEAEAAWRARA